MLVTTHSPYLLDHVGVDDILHTRRIAGHTTYTPITEYGEVARYQGVVMPGAMYASDYFKPFLQKALSALPADIWKTLSASAGGGKFHSNPHGWGRLIVKRAPDRMFHHEIPKRLALLVSDLIA